MNKVNFLLLGFILVWLFVKPTNTSKYTGVYCTGDGYAHAMLKGFEAARWKSKLDFGVCEFECLTDILCFTTCPTPLEWVTLCGYTSQCLDLEHSCTLPEDHIYHSSCCD